MSWSIDRLLGAIIAPVFSALPSLTHDDDRAVDGADRLADAEAEIDSWEPATKPLLVPEPPLTDDELVALRGMIQERYPDSPLAGGDGPAGLTNPPKSPAGPAPIDLATWLEPAVMTVLDNHIPDPFWDSKIGHTRVLCCGDTTIDGGDWQTWQEHVAGLIAAHIARALPAYPTK